MLPLFNITFSPHELNPTGPHFNDHLSFTTAPLVKLKTRVKEPDLAISPFHEVHRDCVPRLVMEVGVYCESIEELELEGDEWMEKKNVQVCMNA